MHPESFFSSFTQKFLLGRCWQLLWYRHLAASTFPPTSVGSWDLCEPPTPFPVDRPECVLCSIWQRMTFCHTAFHLIVQRESNFGAQGWHVGGQFDQGGRRTQCLHCLLGRAYFSWRSFLLLISTNFSQESSQRKFCTKRHDSQDESKTQDQLRFYCNLKFNKYFILLEYLNDYKNF